MSMLRNSIAIPCAIVLLTMAGEQPARCGQGPVQPAVSGSSSSTYDPKAAIFRDLVMALKKPIEDKDKLRVRRVISQNATLFVGAVAAPALMSLPLFRSEVQEWRTDVQTGSPTSSAGTTSLVSKGSVPALLGLAVENGALTQTTSGTSITFRTNPTGLIRALQKQGYAESGPESYKDPVVKFISKTSAAITFNTGRNINAGAAGGQSQGILAGTTQQISSFDVRYGLYNHRDPRDARYTKKWESLRDEQLSIVATKASEFLDRIKGINPKDPTREKRFDDWTEKVAAWVDKADVNAPDTAPNSVQSIVFAIADDFVRTFGADPDILAAKEAVVNALTEYLKTAANIRRLISKSPIVTVEYTDIRQDVTATAAGLAAANESAATPAAKLPDLSNFRLIIAGGTVGAATLTANASLTLFNANPQGTETGRIRDFQLGGQVDIPLREIGNIGVPTLTFSGLFLSLRRQPLGIPLEVNGVNVDLKGNMGFAQAKLSFPLKKGSGISVPLSITYASRTELIKESDVRGSIGVTLNLDSIFAGMKP